MMQLLEHFKELTLHPKNAQELKGLILQFAVQGKLTKQWREDHPDVEPASVLFERINKEKKRLIQEKKIKNEKSLPNIEKAEIPYTLPKSWEWCKLGHAGYTQTGSTPPKNDSTNYGNYIPFIGPGDISNQWMKYPDEGLSEKGISIGRLIPKGSLMMVCIGGSIGKCNINEIDVSCNQQINTLTPIFIPSDFIKTICQAPFFQTEVWEKSSGSATPIINKGKWENIIIPLPPLEEQKAIVETVNQLFAEIEQLEALTKERIKLKADFVTSALNQLTQAAEQDTASQWAFLQQHFGTFFTEKENIKKLREGILQLAVQGKLTRDWRALRQAQGTTTEPAFTLLEKIKAEKEKLIKAGKIKKEKPLPPISEEEIPYELPEGWVWCRMGDLAQKLGAGSTPSGGKSSYADNGIMFFRSQNIHNYFFKLEQVAYITEETHEKMKGTKVKANDLLLNITGGSIGRCALVPEDFNTANVSQHVAIIRLVDLDLRMYMHSLIVSKEFQETIMDVQVGVSREGLSMTKLKLFLVPLPSLEEQKAIVEKVNGLMYLCDRLEQEIETYQTTQEQWMQSCLREVV